MVIKANDPNKDGPNDLFERFELRDKSCGYYCCYYWVKGVKGVFGTFQVFPSGKGTFRTSTDVVQGGVHHRYEDTTYIVNVYE